MIWLRARKELIRRMFQGGGEAGAGGFLVAASRECDAKLARGIVQEVACRLHESMGGAGGGKSGVRSNFLYPAVLLGTSKQVSRALFGR